ncbi:MAG: response regulator transcription factor [Herpetosiphon sp.]
MTTILLVEDETVLAETLQYNLEREGFSVVTAQNGVEGFELARSLRPDLLVLDVMLPGLDGFSLCRMIRKESDVPILMLTARQDEVDRIAGLELGADDYVVKPFSLGELIARVRALLRRGQRPQGTAGRTVLQSGEITLNQGARRVWRAGTEIQFTAKEFDLLEYLMRNLGIVLSRDLLLERVWGDDFRGDPRTVDVHIRWLREKLEDDAGKPQLIQTVRGIGYRFDVAAVGQHG